MAGALRKSVLGVQVCGQGLGFRYGVARADPR